MSLFDETAAGRYSGGSYVIDPVSSPVPTLRADRWSLTSSSRQVPVLQYIHSESGGSVAYKTLTNSAGSKVSGYQKREGQLTLSFSGCRESLSIQTIGSLLFSTNQSAWAFGGPQTFLCTSFTADPGTEVVGDSVIDYWNIRASFEYEPLGHSLSVLDLGYAYRDENGALIPFVSSDSNGQPSQTSTPQPLNGSGYLVVGWQSGTVEPAVLVRQIYPTADFFSFFGSPDQSDFSA